MVGSRRGRRTLARLVGTSMETIPAPLAEVCRGLETVRNVLKRRRTAGRFRQVDGLAEGLSAFGHGDAGRVLQHAS